MSVPERVFLLTGLVVGVLFCVFIPYGAGFDEEMHLARMFDISNGRLLPNASSAGNTRVPGEVLSLSYQRELILTANRLLTPANLRLKIDWQDEIGIETRSIYPPAAFFPQALVLHVAWQTLDAAFIPGVILARLVGLLVYLLGAWLAIRWLPVGKWMLVVLALSPMALFQAATLNADSFTNAASFLFIGLGLGLFASQERLHGWQVWALAGAALLLGLAKPGTILLLPLLLLLPPRRYASRWDLWIVWLGALLAVCVSLAWITLAVPQSHFASGGAQSLTRQGALVLSHLGDFIFTFIKGNLLAAKSYFMDWVGVYGYWVGEVPFTVYLFFPLSLLAALLIDPPAAWLTPRTRFFLAILFVLASAAIMLLYFYSNYIPGDPSGLGKQGRYLIFSAPLLFLSLAGLAHLSQRRLTACFLMFSISLAAVLLSYCLGLYLTYYTDCGPSLLTGSPCVLPVYKNLDKPTLPSTQVDQATSLSQTFTGLCGRVEALGVFFKLVPFDARRLASLSFLVKFVPAGADGTLHAGLLNGGQVIGTAEFQAASIRDGQELAVPVTRPLDEIDYQYELRLVSADLPPGEGVEVAISRGDLMDGRLYENGNWMNADLIYRYTCVDPWK